MFAPIVRHCLIFKTEISWSAKVPSALAGMEPVGSGTIILRLGGKYWRSYAEIVFFFFFKQTNRRWEHSFPQLSRRAAVL